jgi:bifunctional DNase/RNase
VSIEPGDSDLRVYRAVLQLDTIGGSKDVSMRSSDAIHLAMLCDADVWIEQSLLNSEATGW